MPDDVRAFFELPMITLECDACGLTLESTGSSAHVCCMGHDPEPMRPVVP